MLTPRFKLEQDLNHVYVRITAPFSNIADAEVEITGENFLFVARPYFLRLHLPGKISEDADSKGKYICDTGVYELTFSKETPGEIFENLDMITSLLAPKDIPNVNPNLIEVLDEGGICVDESVDSGVESSKYPYGFANKISKDFQDIASEFPQLFEIKEPENYSQTDRHVKRIRQENNKFSVDHYLADFFERDLLEPFLTPKTLWNLPPFTTNLEFTDEEIGLLKDLPNKHFIVNNQECTQILAGLVDILFGYCYEKRTTLNEFNVESGWTINKLSSTLSCFCDFNLVKDVLIASYRRALIYPIFRNFELCTKVHQDVENLLSRGKKFVVKCLIQIHQIFNSNSDARYILNQLYIKDYLVYIQKCKSDDIKELCKQVKNVKLDKNDLSLDLYELEAAGAMVEKQDTCIIQNKLALQLADMSLLPEPKKTPKLLEMEDDEDDDETSVDSSSDDDSSDLDSDDDAI